MRRVIFIGGSRDRATRPFCAPREKDTVYSPGVTRARIESYRNNTSGINVSVVIERFINEDETRLAISRLISLYVTANVISISRRAL